MIEYYIKIIDMNTFNALINDYENRILLSQPQNYYKDIAFYSLVPENNKFMIMAKQSAIKYSLTPAYPIGIVIVSEEGKVLSRAGNGNGYHELHLKSRGHIKGCKRKVIMEAMKNREPEINHEDIAYDLCPGCHTDYHAEAKAINHCENKIHLIGASIYMYGHYWCCKDCWEKIKKSGIKDVFLPDTYKKFQDRTEVRKWSEEVKRARENNSISI